MPEGYRHLTFDERCQIYATGKSGLSDGAIAGRLGRPAMAPSESPPFPVAYIRHLSSKVR